MPRTINISTVLHLQSSVMSRFDKKAKEITGKELLSEELVTEMIRSTGNIVTSWMRSEEGLSNEEDMS